MNDNAVFRFPALLKHGAESVAFPVRKMLLPDQGITEGQTARDPVLLQQRQDLSRILVSFPDTAPAPDASRRSAVYGADPAPFVKIFPMFKK